MDISVVITTCNRPAFLKEALEGIAAQTYKPKEVIIVNDCSDISYESVLDVIKKVNAKHILLKERSGANRARNIGIEECSGEIIAFLDDDDIWLPEYLNEILAKYQSGADAVVAGFKQLGKENVVVINSDVEVTKTSLLRGNTYCGMSGFSCCRKVLEKLRFDEALPNGQDWDMFVRLFTKGIDFRNIPEALFLYRFQNEDGIGAKVRKLAPKDIYPRLASAYKHKDFLGDYWFKKRVSEQVLFSLKHKEDKKRWISLSIKLVGFKATVNFFFRALRRKVLKKPMAI
ncbi:glycosyltransferase family 2 protein [Alteromonas macleodii]|uniref:Glycosyltransferase, family GT2 n=1 Tax=Alteromonas macleodii TaxID=28108 RepID=A0A6T9Y4A4_ALTMA|nr:glycosyltransferase family 2 protein [Alteromonas macleodii]CAB9493542.1 Glycosyltransferase, family GT2 [Alteromonas macleodii]